MGAQSTICRIRRNDAEARIRRNDAEARIRRNDAEARIRRLAADGWVPTAAADRDHVRGHVRGRTTAGTDEGETADEMLPDLERAGRDRIARFIASKFDGHDLTDLVGAVLKAQGYTVHASPPGPDKGIDLLAAPGPLGFGTPRICVQVKAQQTPVERPVLDQLIGVMQNVQADQGLLVSWGGFKSSVDRERAAQFFRVRLWDQDTLIEQLLAHYDRLDSDLRARLPLKAIRTVAEADDQTDLWPARR